MDGVEVKGVFNAKDDLFYVLNNSSGCQLTWINAVSAGDKM